MTKELEETISSFSSFVCTGRINFFPTVRVFFHADRSTAGLSQQLDSEERRAGEKERGWSGGAVAKSRGAR